MIKTCPYCGGEFEQEKRRGRVRIYCSRKCQTAANGGVKKTGVCALCNGPCQKPAKHCKECAEKRGAKREIPDRDCIICGKTFRPKRRKAKCCGLECSKKAGGRTIAKAIVKDVVLECAICGKSFHPHIYHPDQKTCSYKCKRKYDDRQKVESGYKRELLNRRRAIIYGVEAEQFDVMKVFDRDGWVCQICGKKVNRRLKYPHPKSPSLDHIIPLSRGGTHTTDNVQLAHFGCNAHKSDRGGGQLRMFGEV